MPEPAGLGNPIPLAHLRMEMLVRDAKYDIAAPAKAFDKYLVGDPTSVAGVAQEGAGA